MKHKWDLETEKWVVHEESEKSKETSEKESQKSTKESSEEESEEDENTTDEQRKERMFRKRKCQPGWTKLNYFTDPESGTKKILCSFPSPKCKSCVREKMVSKFSKK